MSEVTAIEVKAPCCSSRRSCRDTFIAVIGIRGRPKVLRTIEAVRCYRGEERVVKFYPSDDVILSEVYITTRNNIHIKVLWHPQHVDVKEAERMTLEALGYQEVEEL